MATTTRYAIYYPTTATQITPLSTQFSTLATSVDTAIATYLNATNGTDAQRGALVSPVLKEGLRWRSNDTDKDWLYNGTTWLPESWTAYTPTWTAATTAPSVGNGSLVAAYRYIGDKTIAVRIFLTVGSTTSGGAGAWGFSLPSGLSGVAGVEQAIAAKAYLAAGANYVGIGLVQSAAPTVIRPQFPLSTSNASVSTTQNASSGGAVGTGVPVVSGQYSYGAGSNVVLEGILEIA